MTLFSSESPMAQSMSAAKIRGVQLAIVIDNKDGADAGKQLPDEVQQDLMTFNLRDDWKATLRAFQPAEHFRSEVWLRDRPLPAEWREHRALLALRDGSSEPWKVFAPPHKDGEWQAIVAELRKWQLLARRHRARWHSAGRSCAAIGGSRSRSSCRDCRMPHMAAGATVAARSAGRITVGGIARLCSMQLR